MDLPKITSNRNVSRNHSYYPFKDCTLSISLSLKLTFNMPELNSSVLMCYFDWNLKFFSLTGFKKKHWQDMSNCKQTSFLFLPWIFNNWCFSNRRTSPAGTKVSFTTLTSSKSEVCGLVKETLQHIYIGLKNDEETLFGLCARQAIFHSGEWVVSFSQESSLP